jgi:putative membrane-bound dehydrogenase-like protein
MIRTFVATFGVLLSASAAVADPPLKVPAGFEIKKVAGPPLVKFPVIGDFDEKGRLYVIDMAGPITHKEVAEKKPAHKIVRLDDTDGDGTFDKATTFADELPFPEGCMYLNGSVYSACPPHILKLTDTDGDGKADKREVWWDGKTLTGCANDLHGPYRGPDGFVYWTKGAFAKQELTLGSGKKFTTRASHVFRAKPDGSGLEVMMTGGMDNPVGVAFTASGDLIVSNTFLQHPADGNRDGLIHAVPGGVWGKDHDPIYEHPWTSPKTMPIMTHMGPAAPAGIARFQSSSFGDDYKNNLFCAQFNLRKVSRHVLIAKGGTYETRDGDFVTSDDPDFHPTDVIPAPDESLLVIDTGGWYKLCCPSSQLVKADVFGGIYRIRNPNPPATVGFRAPPPPLPSFPGTYSLHDRRRWAEKATAKDIPKLLETSAVPHDQHVDHAITYALIRIADYDATARGLTSENALTRRSVLAALEAIDAKRLKPSDVLPNLSVKSDELRETAWWIAAKHPEWGGELVGYFRERLAAKLSAVEQEDLTNRLAKFAKNEAVQKLLAEHATNAVALRAMARANPKAVPAAWADALPHAVVGNAAEAFATVRALPFKTFPKPLADAIAAVASDAKQPADLRLAALGSFPDRADQQELFAFVLTELATDKRSAAADVLSRGNFSPPHLVKLAAVLKAVGPVELAKLLPAFTKSTDEGVGLALLAALNEPKLRAAVRTEQLKPILDKYPAAVKAEAAKLYAILDAEIQKQRDKLDALVKELPAGDVQRGHKVFNSQKAACATCHKIGYVGGTTGPDLTRIGSIRTERDLLEAIVFPSLSFVRSYEPVNVNTLDGRQFNGILKKDAPDEIVLVVAADKEERIARDNVETLKPGSVSIMPAGLDQQLTKQDLADLVAFLRASK